MHKRPRDIATVAAEDKQLGSVAEVSAVPLVSRAYAIVELSAARSGQTPLILNEERVAELLGIAIKTLRNWRAMRQGPVARRVTGRLVVYLLDDVEAWARRLAPCGDPVPMPRRRGRPRKAPPSI